nr:MoaD/ThiS family protein [Candidatus Njordarchaeota archaeon]
MKCKIRYLSAISSTLGKKTEEIEIPEKLSMVDLFEILTERHGEKFSKFLFDPRSRTIGRYALVMINGETARNPNTILEIPEAAELVIGIMAAGG